MFGFDILFMLYFGIQKVFVFPYPKAVAVIPWCRHRWRNSPTCFAPLGTPGQCIIQWRAVTFLSGRVDFANRISIDFDPAIISATLRCVRIDIFAWQQYEYLSILWKEELTCLKSALLRSGIFSAQTADGKRPRMDFVIIYRIDDTCCRYRYKHIFDI